VSQQNVDSVRKGIDAFNRRDFDTALELLSDDVAFERFLSRTESQTEWVRGRRELRAVWESQVEAVDLRVEPEEFVAVGAYKVIVPVRMIARGTGSEIRLERRLPGSTRLTRQASPLGLRSSRVATRRSPPP
jgi:ketosteroid isomerase-like protein